MEISKIKLPNNSVYEIRDLDALSFNNYAVEDISFYVNASTTINKKVLVKTSNTQNSTANINQIKLSDGVTYSLRDLSALNYSDVEDKTVTFYTNASQTITKTFANSKNLITYPYYDFRSSNSVTKNGVTFTNNKDGSITINGTPTAITYFAVHTSDLKLVKGQKYLLTGFPNSSYTNSTAYLNVRNTTYEQHIRSTGDINSSIFTANYTDYYSQIYIAKGVTLTNVVVRPQLIPISNNFTLDNKISYLLSNDNPIDTLSSIKFTAYTPATIDIKSSTGDITLNVFEQKS